ncbi:FadR/GntR family transcriptional regulator [Pedobacter sp. AW1-32]|uniref:FadR/GntR family transcriptional regulator n=1 Tax=Pedobacter sp. AW1-32 TaxID=3383026 RepID=UPI003FF05355
MKTEGKLFERISSAIRDDIQLGKFKVGEKLPSEPALMVRYGVGRSTIREAIKSLSLSGILSVQQGFGTLVNSTSAEPIEQKLRHSKFEEVNHVRSILEKEIVQLAIQHRTVSDLEKMQTALQKRRLGIESGQRQEVINADIEFHMSIAKASANAVLADLYESFTTIIRDFFSKRASSGIAHFAMSHYLHEELFMAIEQQDSSAALTVVANILNNNH